jgi:hypothetical protein
VTMIPPQQGPRGHSRHLPWPRRAAGGPAGVRRIDEPYTHHSDNPIDRVLDRVIDADLQRLQRIALARLPRPSVAELTVGSAELQVASACISAGDGRAALVEPSTQPAGLCAPQSCPGAEAAATAPAPESPASGADAVARIARTRPGEHRLLASVALFALAVAVILVVGWSAGQHVPSPTPGSTAGPVIVSTTNQQARTLPVIAAGTGTHRDG